MNKNKGAAMEAARQRKAKRLGERGSGIYPSIKKAVAILLGQTRYDLQSAAASAGLSTQQLRDYLARPNVRAYMRAERKAQIESLCLSNANALARLRDEGPPTAAVNAIRTAEAIRSELIAEDGAAEAAQRASPGLVIVIGQGQQNGVAVEPPQRRLAGARTITEPGAHNLRTDDEAFVLDPEDEPDEPGAGVAGTSKRS